MNILINKLLDVILKEGKTVFGVGIDIEENRPIVTNITKYLTNPDDCITDFSLSADILTVWTIKEALYKSTPNNVNLVLRDFILNYIPPTDSEIGYAACSKQSDLKYIFLSEISHSYRASIALCYQ